MVDIDRQVTYWQEGALDNLEAADALLDRDKIRQALFFAHLAIMTRVDEVVRCLINE